MGGTIVIIIVLVLAPIGILMSSSIFVAVFSSLLNRDVDTTHEGTELAQLAETGSSLLE